MKQQKRLHIRINRSTIIELNTHIISTDSRLEETLQGIQNPILNLCIAHYPNFKFISSKKKNEECVPTHFIDKTNLSVKSTYISCSMDMKDSETPTQITISDRISIIQYKPPALEIHVQQA